MRIADIYRSARQAFTVTDKLFRLAEYRRPRDGRSRLDLLNLEDRIVPARPLPFPVSNLGAQAGLPIVKSFDALNGEQIFERQVFESEFTGGVNVATADFTGDG